jgi:lysophospholipase L1-like esterase
VLDDHGNESYYTCTKSSDNNPVNLLGFRGEAITEKAAATIRIICLGGSTTYGIPLDYKDSYPKLLQDALDSKTGPGRYEVINAGIPAHYLPFIINQSKKLLLPLDPDIIVLMNVFNNLADDGKNFAYIAVQGNEKNILVRWTKKSITKLKQYSTLIMVASDITQKGVRDYLKNYDWKRGSEAIMQSTSVWIDFETNLKHILSLYSAHNPSIHILVLDEPINKADYPELVPPMQKAYELQRRVCAGYQNATAVDIDTAFTRAQQDGVKIWVAPWMDPIHLSKTGNALLANILARQILALDQNDM